MQQKTFFFIRHGQTDWNKIHRCMGQTDIPLNELGKSQAADAIHNLQPLGITHIISSPLKRAHETAMIVAQGLGLPCQVDQRLSEVHWGILQGQLLVSEEPFDLWRSGIPLDQGESIASVQERMYDALQDILPQYATPLIVSHGGCYWALLKMLNQPYVDAGNCHVVKFSPVGQEWISGLVD